MAFSIENHRLMRDGAAVQFTATPNMGGVVDTRYLIMHYTAGMTLAGAVTWFVRPDAEASAHLVIDRNGAIVQMVPFNRIAWHAGRSQWGELIGINKFSIGIELVNAGKLKRRENGDWVNWANNVVPANEVVVMTHRDETTPAGWQVYPEAQLDVAIEISKALNERYGFDDVLGHEDISPRRKVDPGPSFPMTSFESRVMGRNA
jgi:N-acetylmuramoyl-L-alanine amidase